MNNAEYFKTTDRLKAAFEKFVKRRGGDPARSTVREALVFARLPAMTTLDWDVGDVIQLKSDGRYAEIVGFDDNAYDTDLGEGAKCVRKVHVKYATDPKLVYSVTTDEIRRPDFPPELVKLVAASLGKGACPIDLSKCPLKQEGACMKGGDSD